MTHNRLYDSGNYFRHACNRLLTTGTPRSYDEIKMGIGVQKRNKQTAL